MSGEWRTGEGAARRGEEYAPRGPGEQATGAESSCVRRATTASADGPGWRRVHSPEGQREPGSQDNFQGWMTEPASLSAGAKQMQKKQSVDIHLMKHEREIGVPSKKLGSATDGKERSTSEIRKDYVYGSTGRLEKTHITSLVSDQAASRNCELYLPATSDPSAAESSEDSILNVIGYS